MIVELLLSLGVMHRPAPTAPVSAKPRLAATQAAKAEVKQTMLVVPFETPAGDARSYWLGEASAILLTDDLNARGRARCG